MIIPVNKRIVAREVKDPARTSVIITLQENSPPEVLEVVSVCEGETRFASGDKILIQKYGYSKIEIEKEILYIVECDSILGIIK